MMWAWLRAWWRPEEAFVVCNGKLEPQCVCLSDADTRAALAAMDDQRPRVYKVPLR